MTASCLCPCSDWAELVRKIAHDLLERLKRPALPTDVQQAMADIEQQQMN